MIRSTISSRFQFNFYSFPFMYIERKWNYTLDRFPSAYVSENYNWTSRQRTVSWGDCQPIDKVISTVATRELTSPIHKFGFSSLDSFYSHFNPPRESMRVRKPAPEDPKKREKENAIKMIESMGLATEFTNKEQRNLVAYTHLLLFKEKITEILIKNRNPNSREIDENFFARIERVASGVICPTNSPLISRMEIDEAIGYHKMEPEELAKKVYREGVPAVAERFQASQYQDNPILAHVSLGGRNSLYLGTTPAQLGFSGDFIRIQHMPVLPLGFDVLSFGQAIRDYPYLATELCEGIDLRNLKLYGEEAEVFVARCIPANNIITIHDPNGNKFLSPPGEKRDPPTRIQKFKLNDEFISELKKLRCFKR